ncbi:MAG TPA: ABC transporter ATP-binding protein [bacterium]|nr:ABC transporter ATP-binding protein [bacterium]
MVLKTENLGLSLYGGEKKIFRDISLVLNEGEMGIVAGRAGSGKTLLGLTLCGFLPLWVGNWQLEGGIELLGEPLRQNEYRNEVGIVLQNPYTQISGMKRNVLDELAFPLECRGTKQQAMHEQINYHANALEIAHLLNRNVKNLSGGELQRVIIASTLISNPRFLFLDRFMTEIDTDFRPQLFSIIASRIKEFEGSALIAEDPWLLPERHFQSSVQLGPVEVESHIPDSLYGETSDTVKTPTGGDLLCVESLSFEYVNENPVLYDISFSLGSGDLLFLEGPNGAGKTFIYRNNNNKNRQFRSSKNMSERMKFHQRSPFKKVIRQKAEGIKNYFN